MAPTVMDHHGRAQPAAQSEAAWHLLHPLGHDQPHLVLVDQAGAY